MAPIYEPKAKRRKLDVADTVSKSTINSAQDLHDLLQFKQTSSPEVNHGIQQFKDFLTDISKAENNTNRANKFRILKRYCDDQSSGDNHARCLSDLISTWSFAAQSNNDSLLSAVPAVLALFVRTISTQIEFREFGLSLCRLLLEKDQLRLFDRGLTSPKTKEFLISPCLRLLTEIVSFDGGAVANSLYVRRVTAFKRLDVLLDPGTTASRDTEEQRRKPTVRRNAQRYVLVNLKFQTSAVKGDLIAEAKILRRTLQGINRDGSDIISDILRSIKKDILGDTALSRQSKTRLLNPANLASLASLYSVEDEIEPSEGSGAAEDTETAALQNERLESRKSIRNQVHDLLLTVCTHHKDGVLLPDPGWYPLGSDPEECFGQDEEDSIINLGLDSPLYFDRYEHKVPVKNGTLSTFIEGLRPAADTLQSALVLKIFETAPELVADYFSKKAKFTSEPKAEPGWLGEAAFIYSVIELPVPAYCGWNTKLPAMPPPVSIVIESILPRPLDQPLLTRCLNLNDEVITLFAARALTVALKKLQRILALFRGAAYAPNIWEQASDRLKKALSRRSPRIKVIIQALQRAPKIDSRLRGALIDLLAMYFRVLPRVALQEKFDISTVLIELTNRLDAKATTESERSELLEQISNLVPVAEISPLTNWWNKSGSELSLLCQLLRIAASSSANSSIIPLKAALKAVIVENGVLSNTSQAFDALVASLHPSKKWSPSLSTYSFVDNCIGRVVRQPVHYLDLSILTLGKDTGSTSSGPLLACTAEQWPFLIKCDDLDAQQNVAEWIARFFSALGVGETDTTQSKIDEILDKMINAAQGTSGSALKKAFKKQSKHPIKLEPPEVFEAGQTKVEHKTKDVQELPPEIVLENIFGMPASNPDSIQGLDRWDNADLESAVTGGRLSRLLQCVASTEEEVRRQAFLVLRQLMAIVKESSYSEKNTIYLLLGEVCETIQEQGFENITPSIIAEVASRIATVLADPSHMMYGKVNKFLNKAPVWEPQKIISYWVDRVLLKEPEDDNGYDLEVSWLLELVVDGLRTSEDMELYRKANVFERVLSLYCSPQLSTKLRHKILQAVYRAVQVGGSLTLITRAGMFSWIEAQLASSTRDVGVLGALKSAIERSCNAMAVEAWKTRQAKL